MYDDQICKIEKASNGFTISVCDPVTKANNRNSKKPYVDPWKSYVFKSSKEVLKFLSTTLDKLSPADDDDFGTNFARATQEDS